MPYGTPSVERREQLADGLTALPEPEAGEHRQRVAQVVLTWSDLAALDLEPAVDLERLGELGVVADRAQHVDRLAIVRVRARDLPGAVGVEQRAGQHLAHREVGQRLAALDPGLGRDRERALGE